MSDNMTNVARTRDRASRGLRGGGMSEGYTPAISLRIEHRSGGIQFHGILLEKTVALGVSILEKGNAPRSNFEEKIGEHRIIRLVLKSSLFVSLLEGCTNCRTAIVLLEVVIRYLSRNAFPSRIYDSKWTWNISQFPSRMQISRASFRNFEFRWKSIDFPLVEVRIISLNWSIFKLS